MINLKNCRVIIREQKKNSVLADTVILGHNLLTNIIKVRASAMAYRPKEPVGLLVFLENKIYSYLGTVQGAVIANEMSIALYDEAQKKGRKNKIAYIYTYQLNCVEPEKWKILELLEYDKKWLEYITKNRMEAHEDDYDIVYDRMADKRYPDLTNAIEAFYFGEKEATEVVQMIRWKKEADQYCFKNEKALSLLEREEVWIQKMDDNGRWTQERGEID